MKEPATRMMARRHQDTDVKARGLELSSSSPSMAQKPPTGMARME